MQILCMTDQYIQSCKSRKLNSPVEQDICMGTLYSRRVYLSYRSVIETIPFFVYEISILSLFLLTVRCVVP